MLGRFITVNTASKETIKRYLDEMVLDDVSECYLRFDDRIVCVMDHGVSDIPIEKFLLDLRSEKYKLECERDGEKG